MQKFTIKRLADGTIQHIETSLTGSELLETPKLNKGCAFTQAERELFGLTGRLPHEVETLERQVARMYAQYHEKNTPLAKNIYLNVLRDYNETLFYRLASDYLEEMLPILYTPTVGEAVERFSLEHRKSQGLYVSFAERHRIAEILRNRPSEEVDLIVVTDGEAILGIGDQGIGGMHIPIAKLAVYTLCGGFDPNRVLAIQLDVGTNNQALLNDPMYLGWRHARITGQDYDDFIADFIAAIKEQLPHVCLQWEDIGRDNARKLLDRYRHELCSFNDDIQGTGATVLGCLLAASAASSTQLTEQRIIIFGAGSAGVGIADQICAEMQRQGLSAAAARKNFWLVDRPGLLLETTPGLLDFQEAYARQWDEVKHWNGETISLYQVVKNAKPTILIGCSSVPGAFNKEIVTTMAAHVAAPIIFPLSNPTTKAEATPADLLEWTNGKAIIATGSPFADVIFQDKNYSIAQSNNAFIFPGVGLGAVAVRAKYISDDMLRAAAIALSECAPSRQDKTASLLPKLWEAKKISHYVALAVATQARAEGLAQIANNIDLEQALAALTWEPTYYPYKKTTL